MTGNRKAKLGNGAHEYALSLEYTACCMADNTWLIFKRDGMALVDLGLDAFKTLGAARRWFKASFKQGETRAR